MKTPKKPEALLLRYGSFFLVLLGFLGIHYVLWFHPYGVVHYWHYRNRLLHARSELAQLRVENNNMSNQLQRIKNDRRYYTGYVRYQLNMIRRHEVFYQLNHLGGATDVLQR